MKIRACPFCDEVSGVYLQEDPCSDKRLRFTVECVCGVIGAPRESKSEAIQWWNTRPDALAKFTADAKTDRA